MGETKLDYDIDLYDDGTKIWSGPADELVEANGDFDLSDLKRLRQKGDRVTIEGVFEVVRTS